MEFRGTKGEWKVSTSGHKNFNNCVITEDGGPVCFITSWISDQDANAKLIAAAPELLQACIHALQMCEDQLMPTEYDLTIRADRLRAVINKAL